MYQRYPPDGNAFGKLGVFARGLAVTNTDDLSALPEDVQEAINEHEDEFHSAREIHDFAEDLLRRS